MALKMRLKPGERLALNGAVLRNPGSRAVEVEILNPATLLHERDIMFPEEADTPRKLLYFLIQSMHIEPDNYDKHYKDFIKASSNLYAAAFAQQETELCDLINDLVVAVGRKEYVQALKGLQKSFGRPGDLRKQDAEKNELPTVNENADLLASPSQNAYDEILNHSSGQQDK